jgi:hypothetical protein
VLSGRRIKASGFVDRSLSGNHHPVAKLQFLQVYRLGLGHGLAARVDYL